MIDVKDIKSKIDTMVDRIKNDDTLKEQFKKNPIKAVESVLGVDLPDEQVKKIVDEVKAKISGGAGKAESAGGTAVEKAGQVLGGAAEKVTGAAGSLVDAVKKKL